MQEAAVLLGSAAVQDYHFLAAVHARLELDGVNLRHMVDDLYLFAEVFAGNVDAPFGGKVQAHPAVDAAVQPTDVVESHGLDGCHGLGYPAAIIVTEHYQRAGVGHGVVQVELQPAAGHQAAPRNVAGVVLAGFAHVDQGKGGGSVEQFVELLGTKRCSHQRISVDRAGWFRGERAGAPGAMRDQQLSYFSVIICRTAPVSRL